MLITYTGPERPGRMLDDGRLAAHGEPIEVDVDTANGLLATRHWQAADASARVAIDGSVEDVLAEVDGDQDRAIAALQAEHARPGGPRKTLIRQLSEIIDTATGGEE